MSPDEIRDALAWLSPVGVDIFPATLDRYYKLHRDHYPTAVGFLEAALEDIADRRSAPEARRRARRALDRLERMRQALEDYQALARRGISP